MMAGGRSLPRVLIATGLYPPETGGPATHTALLERDLPRHGIEVAVLPFSSVRHLPKVIRHCAFFVSALRRGRKADVLFAQDAVSVGLPARLAAFFLRKPFVVRVPGDYAWEQARQRFGIVDTIDDFQRKRYGFRVSLLQGIQRLVVRSARAVVTPSQYFRQIVEGWGVPQEKVRTIYNGIDLSLKPELPAALLRGRTMVSAGRLVPWKGFGMLIELLPDLPEWSLVIIGDGPLRAELEARAKERGVAERVRFAGALPREELFGWLKSADAFVLNTSFESFSYQIVEAMAAGVPVIATNVGSIPELLENGKEGILLRPGEQEGFRRALQNVAEVPEPWRARTDAARRKAETFSIERTAGAFAILCKELTRL